MQREHEEGVGAGARQDVDWAGAGAKRGDGAWGMDRASQRGEAAGTVSMDTAVGRGEGDRVDGRGGEHGRGGMGHGTWCLS